MTIRHTIQITFQTVEIDGVCKPLTPELIDQLQDGTIEAQTVTGLWEGDDRLLCEFAIKVNFGAMVGGATWQELRDWKARLYSNRLGMELGDNETSGTFTLFIR